jgi:hypothetical protein
MCWSIPSTPSPSSLWHRLRGGTWQARHEASLESARRRYESARLFGCYQYWKLRNSGNGLPLEIPCSITQLMLWAFLLTGWRPTLYLFTVSKAPSLSTKGNLPMVIQILTKDPTSSFILSIPEHIQTL